MAKRGGPEDFTFQCKVWSLKPKARLERARKGLAKDGFAR